MNARIGKRVDENVTGEFGMVGMNDNEEHLNNLLAVKKQD